ncbi:hypothetical protein Tco_1448506 [Tanacetum coccineum]
MAGRGGGWLAKCLIVSNEGCGRGGLVVLGAIGEDSLDGCDGTGGREVNGGGVVLGVWKSLLSEIHGEVMGERGGETIRVDGGAVWWRQILTGMRSGSMVDKQHVRTLILAVCLNSLTDFLFLFDYAIVRLVKYLKGMGEGMFGTRFKLLYCSADSAGSMCRMKPAFNNERNWHLQNCRKQFVLEIHVTWAHLEKKQTRLRLYTKSHKEIIIQTVETASPAIATASPAIATASPAIAMASEFDQDGVKIFNTLSGRNCLKRNPRNFIEATALQGHTLNYNTSSLDGRKYSSLALEDQSLDHLETKLYD